MAGNYLTSESIQVRVSRPILSAEAENALFIGGMAAAGGVAASLIVGSIQKISKVISASDKISLGKLFKRKKTP
jgi:hypothetical protein